MSPIPLHGGGGTAYPFAPAGWDKEAAPPGPPRRGRRRPALIEIIAGRLDPVLFARLILGAAQQDA